MLTSPGAGWKTEGQGPRANGVSRSAKKSQVTRKDKSLFMMASRGGKVTTESRGVPGGRQLWARGLSVVVTPRCVLRRDYWAITQGLDLILTLKHRYNLGGIIFFEVWSLLTVSIFTFLSLF